MAKINGITYPGVTVEKDYKGNMKSISINLKRCSESIKEMLKECGLFVEKSPYNPKFVKKVQDARNGNFTTVTDVKEFMKTL